MLIVTAEPGEHLDATRKAANNYAGEAIVDPNHTLADYLREKGLLDVAITDKAGYAKGVAQPAILVVKRDGEVLEQWAIRPSTVCDLKPILISPYPPSLKSAALSLSSLLFVTGKRDQD